jgi:phage/plasmid-like protein (TIGR03299 family)
LVADLDTVNGKVAMAFADSENPWHRLGTPMPAGMRHSRDAMEAASQDWRVELRPEGRVRADGAYEEFPDRFCVVRDADDRVLGHVGKRYEPLQNADAFAAMDDWLRDGRMTYETAGSLSGGSRVFILARIGEDFLVGGRDPVSPYALLFNSHNGSTTVTIKLVTTRVVCANTLAVALHERGTEVKIRHTRQVAARVAKASEALGLVSRRQVEMFAAFDRLAQAGTTDELTTRAFALAVPELAADSSDAAVARQRAERLALWTLFNRSDTVAAADRDTRWGVFNAVTEYLDHAQPRAGQSVLKSGLVAVEKRAMYSLEGTVAGKRQRVFDLLAV